MFFKKEVKEEKEEKSSFSLMQIFSSVSAVFASLIVAFTSFNYSKGVENTDNLNKSVIELQTLIKTNNSSISSIEKKIEELYKNFSDLSRQQFTRSEAGDLEKSLNERITKIEEKIHSNK